MNSINSMDKKEQIINSIKNISGGHSAYEVFTDWVTAAAIGISNTLSIFHDDIWKSREDQYLSIVKKYGEDNIIKFCEMTALLAEILEDGPDDVLGYIYMHLGIGSKAAGQFFTPFHISELTSYLAIDTEELKKDDSVIVMNEPSCGGGGMILAAAKALNDAGIDYQRRLDVIAQDLDWKAIYMCYVQMSLLGIKAKCIQGDSLSDPDVRKVDRSRCLLTPAYIGVLI